MKKKITKLSKAATAVIISVMLCLSAVMCANAADGDEIPLTPQNNIPLLIVRVDESKDAVSAAKADDTDNEYGTVAQMNGSPDHSVRCVGSVEFVLPEGYEGEYGSASVPEGEIKLDYIRGRGNSTWSSDKKPYKIQLDKKADLFGMGESKEWALLANSGDPSLMLNRITMWLGDQMGIKYSPQMIPVDVVMIGSESESKFLGNYFVSELIDIEESRVNISKIKKDVTDEPGITGGYLLSLYTAFQNANEPRSNWFTADSSKISFINRYPEFESEDLSEGRAAQRKYIRDYINELDALIMADGKIDADRHEKIAAMLDMQSTADYWMIQEFSQNGDAFLTDSTYLHKENGGKLFFGPLWDFDLAWDGNENPDLMDFNSTGMKWTDKLREDDPYFVEVIKNRWKVFNEKLIELASDGGVIDRYKEELRQSWNMDHELWDTSPKDIDSDYNDYDKIVGKIKNFINTRRSWCDSNIDKVSEVFYTVTSEVDGKVVKTERLRCNTLLDAGEPAQAPEGSVFIRWVEKETGVSRDEIALRKDTVLVPQFKAIADMVQPTAVYFETYENTENLIYESCALPDVAIIPEEAKDDALASGQWSSSDESVATVNRDGSVELKKEGDVTITLTLFNGMQKSCTYHIYDPDKAKPSLPTAIKLSPESKTLEVGETFQINKSFEYEGDLCEYPRPIFEIEGEEPGYINEDSVVEVDYVNGVVTAKKPGKVTVIATASFSGEGLDDKAPLTAKCEIIVKEPATDAPTTATEPAQPEAPAKKAKLSKTAVSLKAGKTCSLKVSGGAVKSWSVSNKKVASVKNGKITALKKGSATVTATLTNGKKLSCKVSVKTSPKLSKKSITVKRNKTATVKITGKAKTVRNTYKNTKKAKIISKSSASKIKVKGLKKGKTTLKIKVNGVSLKLKVRVK